MALILNTYSLKIKYLDLVIPKFNSVCINQMPQRLVEKESWKALVCGLSIQDSELKNVLKNSGLIHIFVISGAQLILIDRVLKFIKLGFFFRIWICFLFCLMSGFQPPIFRGFVQKIISEANKNFKWDWPPETTTLLSGLSVLILIPEWSKSLSLSLSWIASLSQSLPFKKDYQKVLAAYILMMFPLWGLSNIHPITFMMNLIVAPFIGFILFPLAVFLILFPFFSFLFDILIKILRLLEYLIPSPLIIIPSGPILPQLTTWLYLFFLHAIIHVLMIKIRRYSWNSIDEK